MVVVYRKKDKSSCHRLYHLNFSKPIFCQSLANNNNWTLMYPHQTIVLIIRCRPFDIAVTTAVIVTTGTSTTTTTTTTRTTATKAGNNERERKKRFKYTHVDIQNYLSLF